MSGVVSLFPYDVSEIVALLPQFETIWGEERWRAQMPYSPHKDSETIFLRKHPGARPRDVLHQLAAVATRHYCHVPIAQAIETICEHVVGRPGRAMLIKLPPGGVVTPHIDEGIYAAHTVRFHLAIQTNSQAWLEVDGTRFHLPAGIWHAMDKHVVHSAANEGETDRIHLVVDCFPDSPEVLAG